MSVCGQTEEESSEEPAGAGGAPVREMYEQKAVSKLVRVLTVLAYLLSVSLAAILLSVYYVCVWQSPKLPPLNDTDAEGHHDALTAHQPFINDTQQSYNHTRGGNTTVSDVMTSPSEEPSSLPTESSEPPDPPPSPPDISSPIDFFNFTWVNITTPDQR